MCYSGTVNTGDAFEMHADKISEESQYAKIVQACSERLNRKRHQFKDLQINMLYGLHL